MACSSSFSSSSSSFFISSISSSVTCVQRIESAITSSAVGKTSCLIKVVFNATGVQTVGTCPIFPNINACIHKAYAFQRAISFSWRIWRYTGEKAYIHHMSECMLVWCDAFRTIPTFLKMFTLCHAMQDSRLTRFPLGPPYFPCKLARRKMAQGDLFYPNSWGRTTCCAKSFDSTLTLAAQVALKHQPKSGDLCLKAST